MKVYKCGTEVQTKISKITGMITCVSIRFGEVKYEISYFDGLKHETVEMSKQEFSTDVKPKSIGFK